MNQPWLLLLMTAGGLYLGKLWRDDLRAARCGKADPRALPGATDVPARAVWIAIAGALALLALETIGEIALGLSAQQSHMALPLAVYSVAGAPIIEEIIFRGYLVVENRGPAAMWAGTLSASLVFSALHPFLWRWDETGFTWIFTAKGWFSMSAVFSTSVWLYVARLATWNPQKSLLPSMAGHVAKNLGVILIKAAGGFLSFTVS